jgi:amino acid permease
MRRNVPILGFIIGLLLPLLGFAIVYFMWFRERTLSSLMGTLMHDHKMASKVFTLSLLINLVPFVYCNTKRLDYTMRGIVTATMIYAVLIVFIMFVW